MVIILFSFRIESIRCHWLRLYFVTDLPLSAMKYMENTKGRWTFNNTYLECWNSDHGIDNGVLPTVWVCVVQVAALLSIVSGYVMS